MLTPVSALSGTDMRQNASTAYLRQGRQDGVSNTATVVARAIATSLNMPGVNILALPGQGDSGKDLAILADALGKIVNLPRKQGESAMEHMERLIVHIRALPAAEQKAVEGQLNQLFQGVTLKILIEAMKNPAGPQAALLAVILETSQLKERDLVARAVVSSYKLNSGVEAGAPSTTTGNVTARQNTPAPPASAAPVAPGKAPAGEGAPATNTVPAPPPAATASSTTGPASAAISGATDIRSRLPEMLVPAQTATQASVKNIADGAHAHPARASGPDPVTALTGGREGITAGPARADMAATPVSAGPAAAATAGTMRGTETTANLSATTQQTTAAQTQAEAVRAGKMAPASTLRDMAGTSPTDSTGAATGNHTPVSRAAAADLLAGREARLLRQLAASLASNGQIQKDDQISSFLLSILTPSSRARTIVPPSLQPPALPASAVREQDAMRMTEGRDTAVRQLAEETAGNEPVAPDARTAAQITAFTDAVRNMAARPDQQAFQAGALIAAIFGRDIAALPYVNYLPAKDEPESPSQHRGQAPSGGEEDGAGPEDHQEQAEDGQENATGDETEGQVAIADDGEPVQETPNFYQRMGDW